MEGTMFDEANISVIIKGSKELPTPIFYYVHPSNYAPLSTAKARLEQAIREVQRVTSTSSSTPRKTTSNAQNHINTVFKFQEPMQGYTKPTFGTATCRYVDRVGNPFSQWNILIRS